MGRGGIEDAHLALATQTSVIPPSAIWNPRWGEWLVEELVRNGCTTFCISPGSRSTPLTLAAARHPQAECRSGIDERGSAYFALGHARATGRPAVFICTSGTAVANALSSDKDVPMPAGPTIGIPAQGSYCGEMTSAHVFGLLKGRLHTARWTLLCSAPDDSVCMSS